MCAKGAAYAPKRVRPQACLIDLILKRSNEPMQAGKLGHHALLLKVRLFCELIRFMQHVEDVLRITQWAVQQNCAIFSPPS